MNIRVASCIWNEETEVGFGVVVPFSTVLPPYLELWLVSTVSYLSSHYPLGDESIAGETDVWEETLLPASSNHFVDVHIQCLLSQIRKTEKSIVTRRFCEEMK